MVVGSDHVVRNGPKYDWILDVGTKIVVVFGPKARRSLKMEMSTDVGPIRRWGQCINALLGPNHLVPTHQFGIITYRMGPTSIQGPSLGSYML